MVSLITATTALNPNLKMTDFNYKKYSLEQLENFLHDAMSAGGASPQEIYDTIVGVVKENYYTYKHQTSQAYELLALLNSGLDNNKYQDYLNQVLSCDKDDTSPECKGAWNDFWQENYYPEELNVMCDKKASDQEKEKCREYNLREAEYYDKRAELDMKKDKVVKWQLPVEVDGASGEYFVTFPDDLLEVINLEEGDMVNWIDRGDGSFELRKITQPLSMDEC